MKFSVTTRGYIGLISATIAAIVLLGGANAFATTTPANGITISPVRSDIEAVPGSSQLVQVRVSNPSKKTIMLRPIANDFMAGDDKGTPKFIFDDNSYAPTHSLKRFMAPMKDMTVAPESSQTLDVIINIPSDARAGGYFGAVRLVPANSIRSGQVNMDASVASLILLTVQGTMKEQLDVSKFSVQQDGSSFGSNIFWSPNNMSLALRLKNEGDAQASPFGKVTVKKGDTVIYQSDFNASMPRDTILPDSSRIWSIPLKNFENFGHYSVDVVLTYGKDNKSLNLDTSLWIIPQLYIAIAGATILGVILLVILLSFILRARRRRNKRVQFRR